MSAPDPLQDLRRRGLLGDPWIGDPARLGLSPAAVDYADRYAGALLGGACGDALGRPAEGRRPSEVWARHGELRDFVPWRGWTSGPKGTITDDTQLTMCLAESIVARGGLDPEDLARRFVRWLPHGRGKGRATVAAVERLAAGEPWLRAGEPSAGNGAAMRAAPIGLLHPLDPEGIRRDGAVSAVVTHADPMAAAGAVAQAFAVAYCLHRNAAEFDAEDFTRALAAALEGVPDIGQPERRSGAGPVKVRLIDQLALAASLRERPPQEAFDRLHNGAFVLESLPAAVYCFLASPADPERVVVTAANGGFDADTVAAMAGNLAGALNGASALPTRWLEDLEYRKELADLAAGLLSLSGLRPGLADRLS